MMITAEEARKKVKEFGNERTEKEKQIAAEEISKAVSRGKSKCRLGIYVSAATKEYLEYLGYFVSWSIKCKNEPYEYDTEISW